MRVCCCCCCCSCDEELLLLIEEGLEEAVLCIEILGFRLKMLLVLAV